MSALAVRVIYPKRVSLPALADGNTMAFAKELCSLPFSPYALDVLLIIPYNREAACALYEEIMTAAGAPTQTGEETC